MMGMVQRHDRFIAAATAVALLYLFGPPRALAEADVFQQAINYVFTGTVDAPNGAEIVDRKACIVVVPDPASKRSIRYYFGRFKMDTARYEKTYAGRTPSYRLVVTGDDVVVEFLNPDTTVAFGNRTAQIPLSGEIELSQRALRLIADRCEADKPKAPF